MSAKWVSAPDLEADTIAAHLAESCQTEQPAMFDVTKASRKPPSLWSLFPFKQAVAQVAILLAVAFLLSLRLAEVKDEYSSTSLRNMQHTVASQSVTELQKREKLLKQRVSSIDKFLDDRVLWTHHARELADSLPDSIYLTSVQGRIDTRSSKRAKNRPRRQLVLKGAVSIAPDGLIPHEVDRLLNRLQSPGELVSDFPVIQLAELKHEKRGRDAEQLAMLTVICLSKTPAKRGRKGG